MNGTPGIATGAATGSGERGVGRGPTVATTETVVRRSASVDTGIESTLPPKTGTINVAITLDGLGLGLGAHGDIPNVTKTT